MLNDGAGGTAARACSGTTSRSTQRATSRQHRRDASRTSRAGLLANRTVRKRRSRAASSSCGLDFTGAGLGPDGGTGRRSSTRRHQRGRDHCHRPVVPEPATLGLVAPRRGRIAPQTAKAGAPVAASLAMARRRRSPRRAGDQFFATESSPARWGATANRSHRSRLGARCPARRGTTPQLAGRLLPRQRRIAHARFRVAETSRAIFDAPGRDFIVSENSFYQMKTRRVRSPS